MKYNPNTYAPYPILRPNTSDYPTGNFTTEFNHEQQGESLRFDCVFVLKEEGILQLVEDGQAVCCVLVYCLSTLYTEVFKAAAGSLVVKEKIPLSKLNGNVEIHPSVISAADLTLPIDRAHPEYGGTHMSVAKYRQLASSMPWSFNVKPASAIESVFRLDRLDQGTLDLVEGEFDFEADPLERHIIVRANAETFDSFLSIRSHSRDLTLATVYLNALTFALSELKDAASEDEPSDGWAAVVRERMRPLGVISNGLAAQKMLGSPLARLNELARKE